MEGFETITAWGALHHEKLNGKGYPFGLKDEEIPLGARIMDVADFNYKMAIEFLIKGNANKNP